MSRTHYSTLLYSFDTLIPPRSEGEPSMEAIEAAINLRSEMGNDGNTAGPLYSCVDDSSEADDKVLIVGDADVPSVHSFEGDSRSSQSHSSAFSSVSNASYRLRR